MCLAPLRPVTGVAIKIYLVVLTFGRDALVTKVLLGSQEKITRMVIAWVGFFYTFTKVDIVQPVKRDWAVLSKDTPVDISV